MQATSSYLCYFRQNIFPALFPSDLLTVCCRAQASDYPVNQRLARSLTLGFYQHTNLLLWKQLHLYKALVWTQRAQRGLLRGTASISAAGLPAARLICAHSPAKPPVPSLRLTGMGLPAWGREGWEGLGGVPYFGEEGCLPPQHKHEHFVRCNTWKPTVSLSQHGCAKNCNKNHCNKLKFILKKSHKYCRKPWLKLLKRVITAPQWSCPNKKEISLFNNSA